MSMTATAYDFAEQPSKSIVKIISAGVDRETYETYWELSKSIERIRSSGAVEGKPKKMSVLLREAIKELLTSVKAHLEKYDAS